VLDLGEPVPADAVANCRLYANRHQAIASLLKGGIVGEVGTQTGRFAKAIFDIAKPRRLDVFDLTLDRFMPGELAEPIRRGEVVMHVGDSAALLATFPDQHFDWLYIDADHSYEGVQRDIAQAVKKVKETGVLVFNDYTLWSPLEGCRYGVLKAVNELAATGVWDFAYLALHPWGYHDVALRRVPAADRRAVVRSHTTASPFQITDICWDERVGNYVGETSGSNVEPHFKHITQRP
jgi:hypothetical protein